MASQAVKCPRDGPVAATPHPSVAFQLKCERELDKLRASFKKQLHNDMLNLFQEKAFADLTFIAEDRQRVSAHSSLLKTRTPRFYNHCLATPGTTVIQPTRIVELPGVKGTQLHKFIRTVYCGEETEAEEAAILDLLLSRTEPAPMDATDGNAAKEGNDEVVIETMLDGSENSNNRCPAHERPNDNEAYYELEDYSSFSEGLNCNGTLADLTDPFSGSASDAMNVSTLNANDDVSVVSAEDLDASEPQQADRAILCSVERSEVLSGSSALSFDLEANLMEPVDPAAAMEMLGGMEDFGSDAPRDSHLGPDVPAQEEDLLNTFCLEGTSDAREKLLPGLRTAADESHLMVRSNESKDGDSGVCCSVSRKLSVSSSCGRHSPCCSEHLQDSPTGSLPKDDSLEFCPDSLTSDDPANVDWTVNEAYQLELAKEATKRRFVALLSEEPRKQAWPDEPVEQRRWSTSSLEGQPKSILKPSAVVPPYNADVDAETTMQADTTFNVVHSSPQAVQWVTGSTNTSLGHGQRGPAKCSVQLDFVPFLEERTASSSGVDKGSRSPRAVADGYGLDADFLLGDSAAKDLTVVAGVDYGDLGKESDVGKGNVLEDVDFLARLDYVNRPKEPGLGPVNILDTKDLPIVADLVDFNTGLDYGYRDKDVDFLSGLSGEKRTKESGVGLVSALEGKDLPFSADVDLHAGLQYGNRPKESEVVQTNILEDKDLPVAADAVAFNSGLDYGSRDNDVDFDCGNHDRDPKGGPVSILKPSKTTTNTLSERSSVDIVPARAEPSLLIEEEIGMLEAENQSGGSDVVNVLEAAMPDITAVTTVSGYPGLDIGSGQAVDQSLFPKEEFVAFEEDLLDGETGELVNGLRGHGPNVSLSTSETQAQKQEGYFVFIDVGEQKATGSGSGSEESAGPEEPRKKSDVVETFFFIPADDKSEKQPEQPELPAASVVPAHQPVYMFIDASSPTSSTNSGHSARLSRPGERKGPVLRRRACAAAKAQRPKSESAATLLADASKILREKPSKRASLAFGDEDEATYSIEAREEAPREEAPAPPPDKWCSKLGRDLLRMFLDEVEPDVVVRVDGRDIKAHKSILTSRCVYFAAMLSGGWVESAGNVIKMQGFSYNAVHFALCHIYGGSTCVPDHIEVSELASLADMLGLEGLKEVVTLALKMKFCHFFHKPCSGCTTSTSECLLIATSFGLDELQEKCLKWITKHMMKAWPTKAFAALPDEILQKCYNAAKVEISADTVLDTLLRCDKLMATLPHVKWTEPVFSLTSRLAETASAYLAIHFPSVLSSHSFLALRSGQSWSIHALETTFLLAIDRLPLDCACQAYVRLHGLLNAATQIEVLESADINENFDALLSKIHRQVELFLIHNANRIVRCNSWSLLTPDLQKKIKDAAVIVFEFGKPTAPPPQLSSLNRKFTRTRASNSTSSASPTIERARISTSAASFHSTPKGSSQAKPTPKTAQKDGGSVKAATLPRAKEVTRKTVPQQNAISERAEAAPRNHHHTGSHTLPLTKTSEIRKKAESGLNKRPSATLQAAQSSRNLPTCKSASSDSSSAGHPRPKSWPVKDRPLAATVSKAKDKTPVRESLKEARPTTTGRATLRTTARQATLTNGNSKPTTPTAPRPKSAVYISGAGHSGRSACNGGVRESKASNLRKAASSDLHGKENIDEIRPRSSTRPRSEEMPSAASKRAGLRPTSARTSRLTTNSKP